MSVPVHFHYFVRLWRNTSRGRGDYGLFAMDGGDAPLSVTDEHRPSGGLKGRTDVGTGPVPLLYGIRCGSEKEPMAADCAQCFYGSVCSKTDLQEYIAANPRCARKGRIDGAGLFDPVLAAPQPWPAGIVCR
jgi:hypothetical protein